jgi:hypothetical protein
LGKHLLESCLKAFWNNKEKISFEESLLADILDFFVLWNFLQKHHSKEHAILVEIGKTETATYSILRQQLGNKRTPRQTGLQLPNFQRTLPNELDDIPRN